jgi:RimJ/RimL family protein N-acetyltransferase
VTSPATELDWPFATERLSLRPAVAADMPAIFDYRRQDSVAHWMTSQPADEAEFAGQIAEKLDGTVVIEHEGVLVGDLYLAIGDPWSQIEVRQQAARTQAEIGWCLAPGHTGRGYATESVKELLRIAFEELGLRRVFAQCFADNEASWRLMERLGMRREQHTKKDSLHRNGEWLDGMMYALLAEEWRAGAVS